MNENTRAEWSIQQVAKIAGTTSRTLRHYDSVGLLPPARIGHNGYRYYDEVALIRLQRILMLRELGLGLEQIGDVLSRDIAEVRALEAHLHWLRQEQQRLARQIASVEQTIQSKKEGVPLMAENMFDGFDHTQYREEVEQRWGAAAYADSDRWWRSMSTQDKVDWQQQLGRLNRDWIDAAESGIDPSDPVAQELARRHVDWLAGIPGTPAVGGDVRGYVIGLGQMYVADPRFGANYGGRAGAEFVRDALHLYADSHLPHRD